MAVPRGLQGIYPVPEMSMCCFVTSTHFACTLQGLVMKRPGFQGHFKNSALFNTELVSPGMNIAALCSA